MVEPVTTAESGHNGRSNSLGLPWMLAFASMTPSKIIGDRIAAESATKVP